MPRYDIQAFVRLLEKRGELRRVSVPVSPVLEMTEIADRVSKRGGGALLFEHPADGSAPVLMNAMGSNERMALSLGAESLDGIGADLGRYLDFGNYLSLKRLVKFVPRLFRLLCCFPLRRRFRFTRPPCRQVVERTVDLSAIPVLQCWPLDGGRYFTLPLVFTMLPDSKQQNVGMYRMQVLDKSTTAMHWQKHKDGSAAYDAWRKRGGKMPVAVAIGASYAATYAATAPLPKGLDEMLLAGFLQKRNVSLAKCVTCDLYVPADAQYILEGYVDVEEELCWEGPFGDHTGYYSLEDWYPRFHVTCITRRKEPIYPATVVGKPPMEDCYMARATERIFLPILKMQMPQLREIDLPFEGVFHNCAVVSVENTFPGAARTVMNAIWGMGQMRYTKMIVAVDAETDPRDRTAVWNAILTHVDPETDLVVSMGPLDALDHSSNDAFFGARLGVDATTKPGRNAVRGALQIVNTDKRAPGDGRSAGERALREGNATLVLVVDADVDKEDLPAVLWRVFNNIDAGRDLIIWDKRVAVDATRKLPAEGLKRPWPEDIVMSEEIKALVDRRWSEYGLPEAWR